jgi:hypothetical protein
LPKKGPHRFAPHFGRTLKRLKDFVYDYHSNIGKAASVGK